MQKLLLCLKEETVNLKDMIVVRFRNKEDHEDILRKVKKMKKFTEELEECLEDVMDDEMEYRGSYRKEWDEDEMSPKNRYSYKMSSRMR